jgi:hypothetical protein
VKRRALLVLVAAAFGWTLVADTLQAAQPPGADWTRPLSIENRSITANYPRGWHAKADGITITISSPGIIVWIATYGPKYADEWPSRPKTFELKDEDKSFQTCGFDFVGWNLVFTDRGQVVQAVVKVEPGASKADAARVLDGLVIR